MYSRKDNAPPESSEIVLAGSADFFNKAMNSKSFKDERELRTCFAKKGTKLSVGETADIELAA